MPEFTEQEKSSRCDVRIRCQWSLSVSEPPTLEHSAIKRQSIVKRIKVDGLTDASL